MHLYITHGAEGDIVYINLYTNFLLHYVAIYLLMSYIVLNLHALLITPYLSTYFLICFPYIVPLQETYNNKIHILQLNQNKFD